MDECIFCRIIAGQIPARRVHEDEECIAFEDLNPQAPHHVLIIPRKHIANLSALAPEDDRTVGAMHRVAAGLAQSLGMAQGGFRVVTNTGADAGQTVYHLHFHLLGGRHLGWPPG